MMGCIVIAIVGLIPIWSSGYSVPMLVVGLILFVLTLIGSFMILKWYRKKYLSPLYKTYQQVIKEAVALYLNEYTSKGLVYATYGKGFRCI
jgi:hypothetical protein